MILPLLILNIQASQKKRNHLWFHTQVLILLLVIRAFTFKMQLRFVIENTNQISKNVCAAQNTCGIVSIHVIVCVVSFIFFNNLLVKLLNVVRHEPVLSLPLKDLSHEADLIREVCENGRELINEFAFFIEI